MRRAKVYLAGAGPGDPELLTVKAARILSEADAVIYDRLVSAEVLALANPNATFIYAGKSQGQQEQIQSEIYEWILRLASTSDNRSLTVAAPKVIVRLKSGDPAVFGRLGEELAFLAENGIEAEVIPGVSSALAGPTGASIPLTYRGVAGSFSIIAGHREGLTTLDWSAYSGVDTLVVMMGVEHRDLIARSLLDQGRPAALPVAFIESASTENERVVVSTLGDVGGRRVDVKAPAVFVIGEVVRLRERLRTAVCMEAFA